MTFCFSAAASFFLYVREARALYVSALVCVVNTCVDWSSAFPIICTGCTFSALFRSVSRTK